MTKKIPLDIKLQNIEINLIELSNRKGLTRQLSRLYLEYRKIEDVIDDESYKRQLNYLAEGLGKYMNNEKQN